MLYIAETDKQALLNTRSFEEFKKQFKIVFGKDKISPIELDGDLRKHVETLIGKTYDWAREQYPLPYLKKRGG